MSFQGIRAADQASSQALCDKQAVGVGYPRCERIIGACLRDGKPLAAAVGKGCPCPRPNAPDPACPYKTTAEVTPVQLSVAWAAPASAKAQARAGLSPTEIAAITTIADAEIVKVATVVT